MTTPNHAQPKTHDPSHLSMERISELAEQLSASIDRAIAHITDVNEQTRLLSFNAQIEAARAGGNTGAAFAVVAQAIQSLSDQTSGVAAEMREQTQHNIREVRRVSDAMNDTMRGTRLADLALNNIDLIDRNLYERTCDVRWWATDAALVDALTDPADAAHAFAAKRMGVILSAYTVYHDLVLVDLDGKVVANGRPNQYRSNGASVADNAWFKAAAASHSGDDYGFQTVSCAVRENGDANGRPLGVLGILFNWDDLAQTIVKRTPIPEHEWPQTRVCIADDTGLVLADSNNRIGSRLAGDELAAYAQPRGYQTGQLLGTPATIAHALAPGYETYTTGWHSVIIQTETQAANQTQTDAATNPPRLAA